MGMETGRSKTKQADHSKPFERNPLYAKKTELCDHISPKCVVAVLWEEHMLFSVTRSELNE